jgi:PAS domain S-box-containing protein
LFEQALQTIAVQNVDGRVVRVNREFAQIFGYSPQETQDAADCGMYHVP